jgi:hypothetical protein
MSENIIDKYIKYWEASHSEDKGVYKEKVLNNWDSFCKDLNLFHTQHLNFNVKIDESFLEIIQSNWIKRELTDSVEQIRARFYYEFVEFKIIESGV